MIRAMINAIGAAMRSIGKVLRAVAAIPGRLIHSILGGGGPVSDIEGPPPVSIYAPVEHADVGAEIAEQFAQAYAANAAMVRAWAASSLTAGSYQSLPPRLPRDLQEWLPGLRVSELLTLINATPEEVSAHLRSQDLLADVRSVRPLAAIEWHDDAPRFDPDADDDCAAPSFLSFAVGHENERFQALREASCFRV